MRAILTAALLAASLAHAQRPPDVQWIAVGSSANALVEYTRAGLQRSGGTVAAFSRSTLVEGIDAARRERIAALQSAGLSAKGYERYLRQVRRSEFDCDAKRVRELTVTDYDASGTVLAWASAEPADAAWTPVVAGTLGAKLLEAVCRVA